MIRQFANLGHTNVYAIYDKKIDVITINIARKKGANLIVIVS